MTAGEGGLVTTNDPDLASRMRIFRNHGITTDHRQREAKGSWFYEMADLGYNYRLTDIQCALGKSQLRKLPDWVSRRQEIAGVYDAAFRDLAEIETPATQADVSHAYHLYAIQLELSRLSCTRAEVFSALRAEGIGVNVHYIPVHLHPYYRQRFDYRAGDIPYAEAAYERLISLPIFPRMKDTDVEDVIRAVGKVLSHYKK
jgi:perosamine synthetase